MKKLLIGLTLLTSMSSFGQDLESVQERSLETRATVYYTILFNKLYMKYNLEPAFAREIAKDIAYEDYENYLEAKKELEEFGQAEMIERNKERKRTIQESIRRARELTEQYK